MTLYRCLLLGYIAVLFAAFGWLSSQPGNYVVSASISVVTYLVSAGLVGLLWMIACRQQLEKNRISLLAIFALVALEAVWFGLVKFFGPPWT